MPAFSYQDIVPVHNQSAGTNPVYTWGTDSQDINMYDTTGAPVSYNMAFTFLNGAPDLNRLILAVSGLSAGTVTLGTTATVSQSGALVGEVQIPLGLPSSPTLINGNTSGSGTVLSSGYTSSSGTNLQNTGWALFKVAPPSPLTLSVKFNQLNGDGIGVTLAYANTGVLKICKVAGQGIDLTDPPFHFTANGSGLDVPPGPGPGGYCEVGPSFAPGTNVTVTETIPAGVSVSNISVTPPAQLVNTNLATGTATVTMGAGVTEVTYTDERKSGYLEICKSGPTSGNFAFSVNPGGLGPFTVPAGACSPAIAVAAGSVTITETTAGAIMVGCSTIPSNRQGACNTTARTSTVTVVPGGVSTQTIATIQNH